MWLCKYMMLLFPLLLWVLAEEQILGKHGRSVRAHCVCMHVCLSACFIGHLGVCSWRKRSNLFVVGIIRPKARVSPEVSCSPAWTTQMPFWFLKSSILSWNISASSQPRTQTLRHEMPSGSLILWRITWNPFHLDTECECPEATLRSSISGSLKFCTCTLRKQVEDRCAKKWSGKSRSRCPGNFLFCC